MINFRVPLSCDSIFHIYNYSVGNELLFRENRNYQFFMDKVELKILPVCNMIAYCLEPDQFHFCLRINKREELINRFRKSVNKILSKGDLLLDDSDDPVAEI